MDLSIIIITYNSRVPVEKCLRSIAQNPPSCSYETIVIDNDSSDDTVEVVSNGFPDCRVITNEDNRGYSRGVNQGIDISGGEFALILNPDIEVLEGSLDRLIEFMRNHPEAGMAGAKLLYPDGTLQYSCRSFYTISTLFLRRTFLGKVFPRARALKDHLLLDYDHEKEREVDWLIGACLIVRSNALEKVGKMDERFFLYFEDTDWCFRMHQHDWQVWYVPSSVMTHSYERSSARSVFRKPFLLHMLSLLRYYEKWASAFYFFRRHRGVLKSFVFVAGDIVAINAAFFAAYGLRGAIQPFFTNSLYPLDWYAFFIVFYNLIFFMIFLVGGLYRIRRETTGTSELFKVVRSVLTTFAILLVATYLTRIRIYSRAVLLGQAVFTIVFVTGIRNLFRSIQAHMVKASFDLKRILLIGDDQEVEEIAKLIRERPSLGMDIVGHVGGSGEVLGDIDDLASIAERFRIQEIVVMPSCFEDDSISAIIRNSVQAVFSIRIVAPVARFIGGTERVEKLGRFYTFQVEGGAHQLMRRGIARVMDVSAGLLFLLSGICYPFWLMYGRASGRLSFFSEQRTGPGQKTLSWPRVVRQGGREASDFLKPSFGLRLLTGKLALVGMPSLDPGKAGRHMIDTGLKPGITGKWRFSGPDDLESILEDEVLEGRWRTTTGYFEILFESFGYMLKGKYPLWFFNKEMDK
ncbi:MAG: glycosyltransferase [Bacteroidales bacterium]|nr:glycosyltransferase [Candidatus Latescibacterota bacterium]